MIPGSPETTARLQAGDSMEMLKPSRHSPQNQSPAFGVPNFTIFASVIADTGASVVEPV